MRVLHIAHYYGLQNTGGAAIGATNFHLALLKAGVDSRFICLHNRGEIAPHVVEVPPKGSFYRKIFLWLTKILRNIWRFTSYRRPIVLDVVPSGIAREVDRFKPDIVHVHWISGDSVSFKEIECLQCPVVVHLHDFWMLGGVNPWGQGNDWFYSGRFEEGCSWLERILIRRKQRFIDRKNVVFAVASYWGGGICNQSYLGRGHIVHVIPYVINPIFLYRPELYQRHGRFVVLFGCYGGRGNKQKGFNELMEAVERLPKGIQRKMVIHVFGESGATEKHGDVEVVLLGAVTDPSTLLGIYHNADVFAFPSVVETYGQTKVEAMLCGLPVVAFNRTACAEGIEHLHTGWIVNEADGGCFEDGLEYFFDKWEREDLNRSEVSAAAARQFSEEEIVKKLKNMYDSCRKQSEGALLT